MDTTKQYPKTQELLNKLHPFYRKYEAVCDEKWEMIKKINKQMEKATGIKDIQIYEFETGWGIGNADKSMELCHDCEIIEGKIMEDL